MTLAELKPNEKAEIIDFGNFPSESINRLNVMGINIGSVIYIDPKVVLMRHNQCFICDDIEFCLRYSDTKKITVRKV